VTSTSVARWTRRGCTALLALAACASAEKRMNQGMALEQRGRSSDAAERYIGALKKDPSLASARARLQESGGRALQEAVSHAAALDASGRSPDAADAFLRADELRRDAAGVGVQLPAPADYAQRRRHTFDRAIAASVENSRRAEANGSFDDAVRQLERASRRWDPAPAQRTELDRARYGVQLGWAEAGMRSGQYRAAYDRARGAAALLDRGGADAERALAIQQEALRRGTVRVAILPIGSEDDAGTRLPADLIGALNDDLELNRWPRAPLFVEVLDPRTVRATGRRHGYTRPAPSLRDAVQLGRAVGADLVLRPSIDSVSVIESDVRETRVAARTAAGVDTAYTLREGRRAVRVRVTYRVVRVSVVRESTEEEVWGSGDVRFREARYAGNPRELSLERRDRQLFDERPTRHLVDEITRDLAPRLERDIFDRLLREVR
jgi:tetratricopeptide (TPR) repeat protein